MANVTLSIDDQLLKKGRQYAQARGTSLNALLRQLLHDATSEPDATLDDFISSLRHSKGRSGGEKIVREDLHRF